MDISALFLPEDLLEHFDVISVLELGDCSTKKMIFEIHLEEKNQLTFIPSGPDLDGYLTFDQEENNFVQVRLLKTEDSEKRDIYQAVWKEIRDKNDCSICPEILAYGEEDGVPYYVSSLPPGEPISFFVKRGGPVPAEVSVKIVLKFIRSLRTFFFLNVPLENLVRRLRYLYATL